MNKDLAYLVGALRDGSVYYDKSRNYKVIWYEQNIEWLKNSISQKVLSAFGKRPRIDEYKKGHYRAVLSSQDAFNRMKDIGFVSPQSLWETPSIIKQSTQATISSYVAGFFDAEGDVNPKKYMIGFSQKNMESLKYLKGWLKDNKINTSRIFVADKKSGTKRFYITSRENFKKFGKLVKFEHPDKIMLFGFLLQQT